MSDDNKFGIKQAGILVRKKFESYGEAEAWARWNYRGTDWEVVQFEICRADTHTDTPRT